jgi:anti-sigma factor RsiW
MSDRDAECPSENELLARVAGTLSAGRVAAVDAHIDECPSCRMVLAEAARGNDEIGLRPVALATFSPNVSVAGRYVVKRRLAVAYGRGLQRTTDGRRAW